MGSDGLSMICAGLGYAKVDVKGRVTGYVKSEHCLDNLKDLQRYLRREDPQQRGVFKQLCCWNTISNDLIPIIELYQHDRCLVLNAVKVLVFLTMPIDPSSDDVAEQIEHIWGLKAALTRSVFLTVVVSLLEDPLAHLECDNFTEADWKLVQLVLTLFRNLLAIQDISTQQKASGSASQFFYVRDRMLELMFQEHVMDLILVLTQHVDDSNGYLRQDNFLLLEIFYYIFLGQNLDLAAKSQRNDLKDDVPTTLDSLRLIMDEETGKRRAITQESLGRHSQFSGTFTRVGVDGAKTLFKGNPPSISDSAWSKSQKALRGRLKRTAWDHGFFSLPNENILELLNNFLIQFLSGAYNVLMRSVREKIENEDQDVQNSDVTVFLQVAHFVMDFQYKFYLKKYNMDSPLSESVPEKLNFDGILNEDICGPIAATMNESMFHLVISKWRDAFENLKELQDYKSLSAAGSLMKVMIHMLDFVTTQLPEDSKESHTAHVLLYKIFYDQTDQGFTVFLLNLFKSFDSNKQPKSDLADLLEIIHFVFCLMEKLEARGTIRVSKKSRKVRKKMNINNKEESENPVGHSSSHAADDLTHENQNPTSELFIGPEKLVEENLQDACKVDEEKIIPTTQPTSYPDISPPSMNNVSPQMGTDEVGKDTVDSAHEMAYSSNEDIPPMMNEVDFHVKKLVANFVTNSVIQNLCWLLKHYKSNLASTNHYVICMLQRICNDLDLSPMLYQLSVLTIFYDILATKKSSVSKEHASVVHFITKFTRKMFKLIKFQPLLFVEILFWKTRKECHYISANKLLHNMGNLKKEVESWYEGEVGLQRGKERQGRISIADALGEDEIGVLLPENRNSQTGENIFVKAHSSDFLDDNKSTLKRGSQEPTIDIDIHTDKASLETNVHNASRRQKTSVFNQEQEATIKILYEKHKNDRQCNHLIAKGLDEEGHISALQIARKLKHLGLKGDSRKLSNVDPNSIDDLGNSAGNSFNIDTPFHTRKRIRAFNKENELELKLLFEQFKDQKCSHMIANALGSGDTFTATQVARKLRQLGLIIPKRRSSDTVKHKENDLSIGGNLSDEETLGVIMERRKRKKRGITVQKSSEIAVPLQEATSDIDDYDNEPLSAMMRNPKWRSTLKGDKLETDAVVSTSNKVSTIEVNHHGLVRETSKRRAIHRGKQEADGSGVDEHPARIVEPGKLENENIQEKLKMNEIFDDSMDSDGGIASFLRKNTGGKINRKMVLDAEDDD